MFSMVNSSQSIAHGRGNHIKVVFFLLISILMGCGPKEQVVLQQIKDVVVDGSGEPMLRAEAIFYNPNNMRMKLRRIKVDVFVNGKKAAEVDQELKTTIPAKDKFSVPLEVKLKIQDLNILDTVLGMIGGRKMQIQYKGSLKLTYHGFPIRVPVDYKDEIKVKF